MTTWDNPGHYFLFMWSTGVGTGFLIYYSFVWFGVTKHWITKSFFAGAR